MLVFTFGILHFGLCWNIISLLSEVVELIERNTPPASKRQGFAYEYKRLRHPV